MLWDEPKIFFLERRYFFSIILSEFLKNRVALQQSIVEKPVRRWEAVVDRTIYLLLGAVFSLLAQEVGL